VPYLRIWGGDEVHGRLVDPQLRLILFKILVQL
jgi:hypothetical protein